MAEPRGRLSPAALRLAGHVGQTALGRVAASDVSVAAKLDQHIAAVRDELRACQRQPAARPRSAGRRPELTELTCPDVPFATSPLYLEPAVPMELLLHYASGFVEAALADGWHPAASADAADWVSLRLAAICRLITLAEAAAQLDPGQPASA
jgi:hypothetical protein